MMDDGSTGDEGRDLGFITLAKAAEIAREHDAELDIDGPRARTGLERVPVRSSTGCSEDRTRSGRP
jgi:hypothetical protein